MASRSAWWSLAALTLVATIDHGDRALISVVAEPLKAEFQLSDTRLGFLMGFAFVLLRVLIALPIGRLADAWNRRNLLAIALSVWSVATLAMGFARSFLELVGARLLIGAGTAGSWPPALSMVSDLFPIQRRGLAMGIWNTGTVVGLAVGLSGGGYVVEQHGWRAALTVFGLVGLALAVLLRLTIAEPQRRNARGDAVAGSTPSLGLVLRTIVGQRSLCHVIAGFSLLSMVDFAVVFWAAPFFVRSHDLGVAEAGSIVALAFMLAGAPGTLLGGIVMDRLARRDLRWHVWSSVLVALLSLLPALGFLLSPSTLWASVSLFVFVGLWSMWYAPQTTLVTGLVTNRMRALAWAVCSIFLLLVGGGLGPQIPGSLSDLLAPAAGVDSLRFGLVVALIFQIWGAAHLLLASRTLRADYQRIADA